MESVYELGQNQEINTAATVTGLHGVWPGDSYIGPACI